MKIVSRYLAPICVLALLAACGPTIGLKSDFETANFEIGKTNRSDVVNYLGLPQKIVEDDQGRKHYFYEGSTRLTGLCVGCGFANSPPGAIPSLMSDSMSNGAEYVFDSNDRLVAKFEPKSRQKK